MAWRMSDNPLASILLSSHAFLAAFAGCCSRVHYCAVFLFLGLCLSRTEFWGCGCNGMGLAGWKAFAGIPLEDRDRLGVGVCVMRLIDVKRLATTNEKGFKKAKEEERR